MAILWGKGGEIKELYRVSRNFLWMASVRDDSLVIKVLDMRFLDMD